jgi:hypothetical protein
MGQSVVVNRAVEIGDLLIIDTDRSFTGQDGVAVTRESPGEAVPGRLSRQLFELDPGIDHVFVLQNSITVRRHGGWDEEGRNDVVSVVEGFLLYY